MESITGRTNVHHEQFTHRPRGTRKKLTVWAIAVALLGGGLTYLTLAEVGALASDVPPTPPEVARDLLVRNAGDDEGRTATFRILLFSDEFRWRLSSHDRLEHVDARPEFSAAMKDVLDGAQEIICVGASSEEMAANLPLTRARALEERRAGRRAEQIALWVRAALSRPLPIRKLNAGYHAPTGMRADTSDQRRVVIILVLEQEQGTNIDQALRSAMAQESVRAPIFETLLTRYSLAAGSAFTWVD